MSGQEGAGSHHKSIIESQRQAIFDFIYMMLLWFVDDSLKSAIEVGYNDINSAPCIYNHPRNSSRNANHKESFHQSHT